MMLHMVAGTIVLAFFVSSCLSTRPHLRYVMVSKKPISPQYKKQARDRECCLSKRLASHPCLGRLAYFAKPSAIFSKFHFIIA